MPSVIDPVGSAPDVGAVTYVARYLKKDGSPGDVEAPPAVTLADPAMGTVMAFPSTEKGVFEFDVVNDQGLSVTSSTVITCGEVDGDLGEGIRTIGPFTDTIEFRGPLGAESGAFSAGDQHTPRTAQPIEEPPIAPVP